MSSDQLSKMHENSDSRYFLLSWILTQNSFYAIMAFICNSLSICNPFSIIKLAEKANAKLSTRLLPQCVKHFPNVIYVDNVTPQLDLLSLVLQINKSQS